MGDLYNDIFRMIHLRGARADLAAPSGDGDDDTDGPVIEAGGPSAGGGAPIAAPIDPAARTSRLDDLTARYEAHAERIESLEGVRSPLLFTVAEAQAGSQDRDVPYTTQLPGATELIRSATELMPGPSRELLDRLIAQPTTPSTLPALLDAIEDQKAIESRNANAVFYDMLRLRRRHRRALPGPSQLPMPAPEVGAVQALGWGDLIVATERLVDYRAREIAHIENILPGERKLREHTLTKSIEETSELETIEVEETERELETTTRHELQTESEKVIAQDFAIATGVTTSGQYGLTSVETSLDAGFARSTEEANFSASALAKEIVSKAVERATKSVRDLRRRTVITQTEELNRHEIDNAPESGPRAAISGIYKWVEKLHEVQLRHYGYRMMVEFSVPEPALSIVGREDGPEVDVPEPLEPDFVASDISAANYLAYAREYGARDVGPPPESFKRVGLSWSSQPSEDTDENKAEDVLAEYIAVPEGYRPFSVTYSISAHRADSRFFEVTLNIGGETFPHEGESDQSNFNNTAYIGDSFRKPSWPNGVPVSMTAHGHFDKTMSLSISLLCVRQPSLHTRWQIETFDALMAGYQRQLDEYNEAKDAARLRAGIGVEFDSAPGQIHRRTEREELQKWAVKILRRQAYDFDAVVTEGFGDGEHDEIDPPRADQAAPLVRFYEEAFEWRHMSYFFYPYFWGRRNAWDTRQGIRHDDPRFEAFLRAGSSRVIVPVTPGYEAKILFYLANQNLPERERIQGSLGSEPTQQPDPSISDTEYETMWLELMLNKNEELALGSGFLNVTRGSNTADLVESAWTPTERDIGRELFIEGDRYEVAALVDDETIRITPEYQGETDSRAPYATGSVPFGPPWIVHLPTNLVVLGDNQDDVSL